MRLMLFLSCALAGVLVLGIPSPGQTPNQPKVAPGPNEPDWVVLLKTRYGLSMFDDLLNPVQTTAAGDPRAVQEGGPGAGEVHAVDRAGPGNRPRAAAGTRRARTTPRPAKHDLWSYTFKNTTADLETGKNLPPPLAEKSATEFDPGDAPFGLWVSNDGLKDGGVFTQPRVVAAVNARLAKQPYKAMIYPYRDKATGKNVPHSYLIGWEYSTNDDFQDVVCQVDNVDLVTTAEGP